MRPRHRLRRRPHPGTRERWPAMLQRRTPVQLIYRHTRLRLRLAFLDP